MHDEFSSKPYVRNNLWVTPKNKSSTSISTVMVNSTFSDLFGIFLGLTIPITHKSLSWDEYKIVEVQLMANLSSAPKPWRKCQVIMFTISPAVFGCWVA